VAILVIVEITNHGIFYILERSLPHLDMVSPLIQFSELHLFFLYVKSTMQRQKLIFWKRWLIHSSIIWLFFSLLYFSSLGDLPRYPDGTTLAAWDRFIKIFLNPEMVYVVFITIFLIELNYQYPFKKSIWLFISSSVATGLTISWLLYYNFIVLHGPISLSLKPTLIIAPYTFAYPLVLEYFKKRIFKAERLYERSTAELNVLRGQIHPHFFFNTLNSIYGLALHEKAERTASALEKLSDMMRYVLKEGSEDIVPVGSELKFVSEFIELQQMRLPENSNMQFDSSIEYDDQHAVIVPLLILPIIENAFQYSVSMERKSFIDIKVTVRQKKLQLHLKNSINPSKKKGNGIGLENVRRRLQIFYPGRHLFDIFETSEDYRSTLEITL
jgi:hypothetical protein